MEVPFIGLVVALAIVLIVICLYLSTLRNTLALISERNRKMNPNAVWIYLIPFVGLIHHFIVVGKLSGSLKKEFADRNIKISSDMPAYNVGMWFCFFFLLSACIGIYSNFKGIHIGDEQKIINELFPFKNIETQKLCMSNPYGGEQGGGHAFQNIFKFLIELGGFICWIIYWAKVAYYKRLLSASPKIEIASRENNYGDLEKLSELKNKGVITNEEFEQKKKQILKL